MFLATIGKCETDTAIASAVSNFMNTSDQWHWCLEQYLPRYRQLVGACCGHAGWSGRRPRTGQLRVTPTGEWPHRTDHSDSLHSC